MKKYELHFYWDQENTQSKKLNKSIKHTLRTSIFEEFSLYSDYQNFLETFSIYKFLEKISAFVEESGVKIRVKRFKYTFIGLYHPHQSDDIITYIPFFFEKLFDADEGHIVLM